MKGDGPGMSPGGIHPSGREVACPSCGATQITDPPHPWRRAPCRSCGYSGR